METTTIEQGKACAGLADYLENNVRDTEFDMRSWIDVRDGVVTGCALGWAIMSGQFEARPAVVDFYGNVYRRNFAEIVARAGFGSGWCQLVADRGDDGGVTGVGAYALDVFGRAAWNRVFAGHSGLYDCDSRTVVAAELRRIAAESRGECEAPCIARHRGIVITFDGELDCAELDQQPVPVQTESEARSWVDRTVGRMMAERRAGLLPRSVIYERPCEPVAVPA
jgi:hypothetical protein